MTVSFGGTRILGEVWRGRKLRGLRRTLSIADTGGGRTVRR